MHLPLKITLKKSAGEMYRERQAIRALWKFFYGDSGGFLAEWVGGLEKVREVAEWFPRRSTAHRGWPNSRPARAIHTQGDHFAFSSTTTLW